MPASDETLRGRLLDGRYLIREPIARGGMATVYRATDTRLDRTVAVKVMHPAIGADASFAERFVREAQSAAKLNHPNVVAVFDQGEDDGTAYLVMELVEGRTLRDLMREEAPLPPRRALALLEQVLLALAAAHEARIVHRDVKPENVLLAPDGRVKVADFGLARAVTSVTGGGTSTSTGVLIGTVSYLAPELVLQQGSDARSDVYACGAVLYEMLTGHKPHSGETPIQIAYRHVHEDVPPPSRLIGGIPPYIDALIARATARERDTRSADARVLLRQLRQVRHALDRGLADDPELTMDLLPRSLTPPAPDVPGPTAAGGTPTLVVGGRDDPEPWVMPPTMRDLAGAAPPQQPPAQPPPPSGPPPVPMHQLPPDGSPDEPTTPVGFMPPHRRRTGLIWLSVVVLLAVVAAAAGFYFGVMRYTTTPELTGQTERSAREIAQEHGLDIDVANEEYSDSVPAGEVIETDPEPGNNILDGGTVDVTLSRGEQYFDVPHLEGLSKQDATAELTDNELAVGEVVERFSESVPAGDVIRASTKPGKSVPGDTEINLFVSKGREPIDVASYVGERVAVARGALEDARFDVDISREYNADVPARHVISQSPDSGSAYRDDTIQLIVSRGPELVTVPNVRFTDVDDATDQLEELGLKVDTVDDELSVGAGIVRDQSPGADERVARGSTVTLYVV